MSKIIIGVICWSLITGSVDVPIKPTNNISSIAKVMGVSIALQVVSPPIKSVIDHLLFWYLIYGAKHSV